MLKKKHLICSLTMSYRSMGIANYRTWRHPNLLLSPDHLLPSPVVCRSLPSLKSKWRFDDLTAHSYQNVSCSTRLKFVAAHEVSKLLDDLQAPAWIVRHQAGELEEIWEIPASMILLNLLHSAASSCWRPSVWSCARKASKKSVSFSRLMWHHGFSMDSAWISYVSDYLSMKFTIFLGFPSCSSSPSDHQTYQTRHPGEKSHPFTVPAQEICCKGKGPCHVAQQSTLGRKRQCGTSQQKCQCHSMMLELTGCHSDCKKPKPSWHQLDSIAPGFSATVFTHRTCRTNADTKMIVCFRLSEASQKADLFHSLHALAFLKKFSSWMPAVARAQTPQDASSKTRNRHKSWISESKINGWLGFSVHFRQTPSVTSRHIFLQVQKQFAHSCDCSWPISLIVSSGRRWGWSRANAQMALAAAWIYGSFLLMIFSSSVR